MASLRPTPKVLSGATWATLVTFAVNSITPEMLAGLGKWEPLVSAGIAIVSYAAGSYLKADPSTTAPAAAAEAPAADPATVVDELAKPCRILLPKRALDRHPRPLFCRTYRMKLQIEIGIR